MILLGRLLVLGVGDVLFGLAYFSLKDWSGTSFCYRSGACHVDSHFMELWKCFRAPVLTGLTVETDLQMQLLNSH